MVDLTLATLLVAATNIGVAIATITIASVAYKQMQESRRQAKQQLTILSDQTAILRSQQDPLLKAHAFYFQGNQLFVKLINRGKGRARRIGVEAFFYPADFQATDGRGRPVKLTQGLLQEHIRKGEGVPGRYIEKSSAPLKYEKWQNGEPWYYVNFLASQITGDGILDPGEDHEFLLRHGEPRFKIWLDETNFVHLAYNDLKKVIRDSGFQFVSIWFRIICKDSVDRPVYGESHRFIADIDEHQTLEEGMRKGSKPGLFVIDAHEVETEMGGLDGELYKFERSTENMPFAQREQFESSERSRGRMRILKAKRKRPFWSRLRGN